MADLSEQAAIVQLEERLAAKHADLGRDRISAAVQQAHAQFEASRIRDFVPLLVERRAHADLTSR